MKYIVFFLFTAMAMNAQDLEKHQWKNRVIVVSSPSADHVDAQQQLRELKAHKKALTDRKLVIYHLTNAGYATNFDSKSFVSAKAQNPIHTFEVYLIGLDGTEKFRASTPQKAQTFFDLIDAMPMRQAEIKNR